MMYVLVPHRAQSILDAFILLAEDNTLAHDLAHRRGFRVQTLGGGACREILLGQDADEGVTFTNRKAADIGVAHPSCSVSERGAWCRPFDTSAHQLSNDHDRTPVARWPEGLNRSDQRYGDCQLRFVNVSSLQW